MADYEGSTFKNGEQETSKAELEVGKPTRTVDNDDDTSFEIAFAENDPRDPRNFSKPQKWMITLLASLSTFLASIAATSYNMGFPSMIQDLHCTELQATLGLSLYALGFGIVPLFTTAFSEEFGRYTLYLFSIVGFTLMHLMIALATNIETVIVGRLLQGAFGSTGATVVAGTITDLWANDERGLPMTLFAAIGFTSNGLAAVAAGWIEMHPHLHWRWIQWISLVISAIFSLLTAILMKETRSAILLSKIVKQLQKKTGDARFRLREERPGFRTLIWISCTRPIYLLCTEPIVMSNSLWIGFAWGIFYAMIESIPGVYSNFYAFSEGEIGNVFITMSIGSILGFFTNMYQERLYRRHRDKRHAEARLYLSFLASFFFPAGMYIFAWTARPSVHWIASVIGVTIYMWSTFIIYVTVFNYLADCYGPFASSALAGQSLFRNITATVFPLFVPKMYSRLTYAWGNTLFASIAVLMLPIPFVMFLYGPTIRRRSVFARGLFSV